MNGVKDSVVVTFYNVENLFDTKDDPSKIDEDFTPGGKLKWDETRYTAKLAKLSEVIDALPGELPIFIGMCEIENLDVLQDLVLQEKIRGVNYEIIHQDSPDERGIDVAALYDPSKVKVLKYVYTQVSLTNPNDPYTRDVLYVSAMVEGEEMHFFMNHWPSRSGGQVESEGNRITVAQKLKVLTDSVQKSNAEAKILIMGDFNDYPIDKSVVEVLGAGVKENDVFFNYMYDDHISGSGSYYYKGAWGALDQFIGSQTLKSAQNGWQATPESAHIFRQPMILFIDKEGVARPNRTYAGDNYTGGYSDHLPIYINLTKK